MKKILKIILKSLLCLFTLLTIPNYYSLIYKFNEGVKFQGEEFYNPYKNIDGKVKGKGCTDYLGSFYIIDKVS